MRDYDPDADLENLMRRWHHTTELTTAAWAEYLALHDVLPPADRRVTLARSRWQAAESECRRLMADIEHLEGAEAA